MNPLAETQLDEAVGLLGLPREARVLEVACGKGEVLRRIHARFGARGYGYDSDTAAIAAARERAPGLDFLVADAPPPGPWDLVACVASSHALGGFPAALAALRELAAPGGQVLLGEGYWRRPPSEAYLAALGGASADELPGLPGLLRACEEAALTPLWMSAVSEADWDRYEWRLVLNTERWAAEHPADPGAATMRERAARARARLGLPHGRETLGFALLILRRDEDSRA